ncbi:DnaJ domain-containing protein [Campylobacter coli]|uniref:DnaJ domain-containing protein n=1 Tax=Campylobacter coli TaxID=195 RepID=UPI001177FE1E|nr:DnaJ domain-containing protein [Campylobacter coli]
MQRLLLLAAIAVAIYWWWSSRRTRMTPQWARRILGVGPDATAEDIRTAHRRLIQIAHPDNGGSASQAADVNLARDTLLARLPKEPR